MFPCSFYGYRLILTLAVDTYRSKTCSSIQAASQDVTAIAPHYDMRVGKRMWLSGRH